MDDTTTCNYAPLLYMLSYAADRREEVGRSGRCNRIFQQYGHTLPYGAKLSRPSASTIFSQHPPLFMWQISILLMPRRLRISIETIRLYISNSSQAFFGIFASLFRRFLQHFACTLVVSGKPKRRREFRLVQVAIRVRVPFPTVKQETHLMDRSLAGSI
jgi:hypothetical protein